MTINIRPEIIPRLITEEYAKWHKGLSMPGKNKIYLNGCFLGFYPNLYGLI